MPLEFQIKEQKHAMIDHVSGAKFQTRSIY